MFTEHLWDIKYWIKFFECRISFSMFTTTSRVVLLTCPFYRWGNEVLENSVICLRSNSLWVAGAEFAFSWSRPRAHALCHQAALISFRSWLGFISMVVFRLTWSSPQVLLYESCGSTTLCGYVVCWQRPACLWWEVWTYTDGTRKGKALPTVTQHMLGLLSDTPLRHQESWATMTSSTYQLPVQEAAHLHG